MRVEILSSKTGDYYISKVLEILAPRENNVEGERDFSLILSYLLPVQLNSCFAHIIHDSAIVVHKKHENINVV